MHNPLSELRKHWWKNTLRVFHTVHTLLSDLDNETNDRSPPEVFFVHAQDTLAPTARTIISSLNISFQTRFEV